MWNYIQVLKSKRITASKNRYNLHGAPLVYFCPTPVLLSSHSAGTKVTLHLVRSRPIYVKFIFPRTKITVDNNEGCGQVVCHKIWGLNLYSFWSKLDQTKKCYVRPRSPLHVQLQKRSLSYNLNPKWSFWNMPKKTLRSLKPFGTMCFWLTKPKLNFLATAKVGMFGEKRVKSL